MIDHFVLACNIETPFCRMDYGTNLELTKEESFTSCYLSKKC